MAQDPRRIQLRACHPPFDEKVIQDMAYDANRGIEEWEIATLFDMTLEDVKEKLLADIRAYLRRDVQIIRTSPACPYKDNKAIWQLNASSAQAEEARDWIMLNINDTYPAVAISHGPRGGKRNKLEDGNNLVFVVMSDWQYRKIMGYIITHEAKRIKATPNFQHRQSDQLVPKRYQYPDTAPAYKKVSPAKIKRKVKQWGFANQPLWIVDHTRADAFINRDVATRMIEQEQALAVKFLSIANENTTAATIATKWQPDSFSWQKLVDAVKDNWPQLNSRADFSLEYRTRDTSNGASNVEDQGDFENALLDMEEAVADGDYEFVMFVKLSVKLEKYIKEEE